jgi:hypothetical protein
MKPEWERELGEQMGLPQIGWKSEQGKHVSPVKLLLIGHNKEPAQTPPSLLVVANTFSSLPSAA